MISSKSQRARIVGLRGLRRERVLKEIALLEHMDSRLWRLGLLCSGAFFVAAVAVVFSGFEILGHLATKGISTHVLALGGSILLVGLLAWMWRYPIWGAALLGYVVLIVLFAAIFEDVLEPPDLGWPSESGKSDPSDNKSRLRNRVQLAIAKRKRMLERRII